MSRARDVVTSQAMSSGARTEGRGPRKPAAKGAERVERTLATNREARFRFELVEHWEAGLVLTGSEVKSLRAKGAVNLSDAFVRVKNHEAWLVNCHVAPYSHGTSAQHDPMRPRKLLLHAAQVERIERAVQQRGLTVVPTRLYFSGPHVKVQIALGRGRKLHDKREAIKKRELDRASRREER